MNPSAQESFRAKLKFLADVSVNSVYVPSKGGGDRSEHLGNYRDHQVDLHDARAQLPATDLDREGFTP